MSKRRLQVKDFESAVGTYTPRTQAQVGTFAYVPPSKPSGQSDLEQLSKAFETLGDASLSWALGRMDQENREDSKAGITAGNKAKLDLLNNIKGGIETAIRKGYLDRNDSPLTKQAYLARLGELFATSGSTQEALTEGMEDLANKYWSNHFNPSEPREDVDPDSIEGKMDSYDSFEDFAEAVLNERVSNLTKAIGTNRFTLDFGFTPAMNRVSENALNIWAATGKKVFDRANRESLGHALDKRFEDNTPQEVVNWFASGSTTGKPEEDPEDPLNSLWRSANISLPYNSVDKPREFFFSIVKSSLIGDIPSPLHPGYTASVHEQLDRLRLIRKSIEPNSGRRVDGGVMEEDYIALQSTLENLAAKAGKDQAAAEAAVKEETAKLIAPIFRSWVSSKLGANPETATAEHMHKFLDELKAGKVFIGGKQVLWADPDPKQNPYGLHKRQRDVVEHHMGLAILDKSLAEFRARASSNASRVAAQKKGKEDIFDRQNNILLDLFKDVVKARVTGIDAPVDTAKARREGDESLDAIMDRHVQNLLLNSKSLGLGVSKNELEKEFRAIYALEEFEGEFVAPVDEVYSEVIRVEQESPEIFYNLDAAGLDALFEKRGWTTPGANRLLTRMKQTASKIDDFRVLTKTDVNDFSGKLWEQLIGTNSLPGYDAGLADFLHKERQNLGARVRVPRYRGGEGVMLSNPEVTLYEQLDSIVKGYHQDFITSVIAAVGRNPKLIEQALEKTYQQANDEPVVVFNAEGEKIQVAKQSILNKVITYPKNSGRKITLEGGEAKDVETWEEWIKAKLDEKETD